MEKYALIRQKRDDAIAKRTERKNRRTFPPSIFQLNPIIAPIEIIEPDIILEPIEEPILEPILEPIDELVLLIEEQPLNVLNEDPIEDIPDIINPALIAQAEELRKLILLQETIKRFSKKKI
jgi:hypothetical protein